MDKTHSNKSSSIIGKTPTKLRKHYNQTDIIPNLYSPPEKDDNISSKENSNTKDVLLEEIKIVVAKYLSKNILIAWAIEDISKFLQETFKTPTNSLV